MLLLCGLGGLGEKKNIPRQLLFSRKAQRFFLAEQMSLQKYSCFSFAVFAALARKNIPRQLLFSRKAAEDAKASQGLDQEVFGLNKKVMKSGKEKEELLKREAEHLAESKA